MPTRRLPHRTAYSDSRPPLARLASVVAHRESARGTRMFHAIRASLSLEPNPKPWLDAAHQLHRRGAIGHAALHYLVEIFLEGVIDYGSKSDPELLRIQRGMTNIERSHGLEEDDHWYIHEAPADWRTLNDEWEARASVLEAEALHSAGYAELAHAKLTDPDTLDDLCTRGNEDFWGRELASLDDESDA